MITVKKGTLIESPSGWLWMFLLCTFLTYSWCLYQLAYARGAYIEMLGNKRVLDSCQTLITGN